MHIMVSEPSAQPLSRDILPLDNGHPRGNDSVKPVMSGGSPLLGEHNVLMGFLVFKGSLWSYASLVPSAWTVLEQNSYLCNEQLSKLQADLSTFLQGRVKVMATDSGAFFGF